MFGILVLISLFIFYALFIGRTIMLYRQGLKILVLGTSSKTFFERAFEYITLPALIVWSVLIVLVALQMPVPIFISEFVFNVVWLRYVGLLFCCAGLVIFLLALISFGKSWRIGIDEKNSVELVTGGIFRYSRNPIFLFMDLYFGGIMLIYPNIVFIVGVICTIIGIHLQILREEKFLLNKFGEKYVEYKKRTRRYF